MKEFSAQNGGRYTYADDLINLQDLALSFVSIYDGCENFIISGCEVSGSTVSEGYVYINKKIRRFNGATGVSFPGYIYENDITETIEYVTGGSKVGRNIFGCAYGTSVPSGKQYISFNRSGVGLRLKDAFFGANCLLLSKQIQQILGNVSLTGNFTASGSVEANAVTLKTLNFKNASNNVVAAFGISSGNTLSLTNSNGNINITGQSFVDIGPAIKENGQLLSTKYVNRSELQSWVFGDAPTGGMTQLQCDASYARLSEFLADMATNETNKQKIRENIGAASLAQVNPVNDTGWITFNNGTMHARQWGRMVSVYGTVSISADARNTFTLPNDIGAPAYDLIVTLCYTGDNASRQNTIVIKIEQGEKTAVVLSRFVADTVQMNNLIVSFNYMV